MLNKTIPQSLHRCDICDMQQSPNLPRPVIHATYAREGVFTDSVIYSGEKKIKDWRLNYLANPTFRVLFELFS